MYSGSRSSSEPWRPRSMTPCTVPSRVSMISRSGLGDRGADGRRRRRGGALARARRSSPAARSARGVRTGRAGVATRRLIRSPPWVDAHCRCAVRGTRTGWVVESGGSGSSSARLECTVRDREVGSSNLPFPTSRAVLAQVGRQPLSPCAGAPPRACGRPRCSRGHARCAVPVDSPRGPGTARCCSARELHA